MPEYLLITDPDGTNRTVPKSNLPFVQKQNAGFKEHERLTIGQTFPNEETANAYIKMNPQVLGHSPVPKIANLQGVVKDQQTEIDILKAKLAEMENKAQAPAPVKFPEPERLNVVDSLAKIKTATPDELREMLVGEDRKTIIDTINNKLKA